jgi:hypothetical protein
MGNQDGVALNTEISQVFLQPLIDAGKVEVRN